jgi:hypothetical protein
MGVLQIARVKMFSQAHSKHPCQRHHATLHGVVFDILVGSENHVRCSERDPAGDYKLCSPSQKSGRWRRRI